MKRSEMIKVIADYIQLRDEDKSIDELPEDAAEYILGCCETWEMLPPGIEDSDYIPHNEISVINEWEPEDV